MALDRIGEGSQVSVVSQKDVQRVTAQIKQNRSAKKPARYNVTEKSEPKAKPVFKRNYGKPFEHNLESVVKMQKEDIRLSI